MIDTNVDIEREGRREVPKPLGELEKILRKEGHDIIDHKLSKEEVRNYENEEGRKPAKSKIATYADLRLPKYLIGDEGFYSAVARPEKFNERVYNSLLYAIYDDQVDVLVSEDKGIHEKAQSLGIADDVFTIEEGREHFREEPPLVSGPPSIQKLNLHEIDIDDPIFDSLKNPICVHHPRTFIWPCEFRVRGTSDRDGVREESGELRSFEAKSDRAKTADVATIDAVDAKICW